MPLRSFVRPGLLLLSAQLQKRSSLHQVHGKSPFRFFLLGLSLSFVSRSSGAGACYYAACYLLPAIFYDLTTYISRVLETVHTIFLCMTLYLTAVTHFGEVEYLAIASWPQIYSVFVTGLVETPVQVGASCAVRFLSKPY